MAFLHEALFGYSLKPCLTPANIYEYHETLCHIVLSLPKLTIEQASESLAQLSDTLFCILFWLKHSVTGILFSMSTPQMFLLKLLISWQYTQCSRVTDYHRWLLSSTCDLKPFLLPSLHMEIQHDKVGSGNQIPSPNTRRVSRCSLVCLSRKIRIFSPFKPKDY